MSDAGRRPLLPRWPCSHKTKPQLCWAGFVCVGMHTHNFMCVCFAWVLVYMCLCVKCVCVCVCVCDMSGTNSSSPPETPEDNSLRLTFIMSLCKKRVCLLTLPLTGKHWNDVSGCTETPFSLYTTVIPHQDIHRYTAFITENIRIGQSDLSSSLIETRYWLLNTAKCNLVDSSHSSSFIWSKNTKNANQPASDTFCVSS